MWKVEIKNLPAGVSHLIVDDQGVIALVKKRGKTVKAGPLLAAAPEMLDALRVVNKIIAEAAMTGFNCHDGDWAERLFQSQQATSNAMRKAEGRS